MRLAIEMLPENTDQKLVARLQHDVEEINNLIGEFLVLGRELHKEAPQQIDIRVLLEELADDARNEGAQVSWHSNDSSPISVGTMALRRILANLLGNAIRYSANKPVEIDFSRSGEIAVIRILDRGPGIPAAELENVFHPFYRLESSRSNSTGGSGLGLAIARQLALANNWKIELLPRLDGGTEAKLTMLVPR
jgi:two-component system osmolarity sensor histidine kinase EnvZ